MFPIYLCIASCFSYIGLGEEQCDFKCWIRKLNISIDGFSTETSFLGIKYEIDINNIKVYGMDLSYLDSEFYPDPHIVQNGLEFEFDLQASSDFTLVISTGSTKLVNAAIHATITEVDAQIGLDFIKDEFGLIKAVISPEDRCSIKMNSIKLEAHFSSAIEQKIFDLLDGFIENQLKQRIGPIVCTQTHDLIGTEITQAFESANKIIRPYLNGTSPIVIPIDPDMSDLRKSDIVDVLRLVLTNFTGTNGPLNLNALVNRFTNGMGKINLAQILNYFNSTKPLEISAPIPNLNTTLNLTLLDLNLSGLNTWQDFTILEPESEYILDTHTGMDALGINLTFMINVSFNGTTISTGDSYLSEIGDLDLYITKNKMMMKAQIAHKKDYGLNWTDPQCINLGCIESLLSPHGTGLTYLFFNTSIDSLSIEAGTGDMEAEIRKFINNIVKFFVDNYRPILPTFVTSFVNSYGTSKLNALITEELSKADCKYIAEDPYKDFVLWTTVTAASGALAISLIIFLIMRPSLQKKTELESKIKSLESLNSLSKITEEGSIKGCWGKFLRTDDQSSLLMTSKLSSTTRILMPLLVLLNIAVFISSNTGIGASVFCKFMIGTDKLVSLPSIEDFSLINSIKEMWEAKTYFLSVLIAVMSCAWPYMKLLMMLGCWCLPSPAMKPERREKWLRFLDALGKWSLVDSFVMVLMLIAFNFDLYFPIISGMIDSPFSIHLWVYPAYGFLTLMLGTVISLALSHVMLALERKVDSPEEKIETESLKEKNSLAKYVSNKFYKVIPVILILISGGLLGIGLVSISFSFNFVGLAGYALNLLDTPHEKHYSVIDLALKLPDAAQYPNSFTIRFTQALYIVIAIIMPIMHVVTLFIMWVIPMTYRAQKRIYVAAEVMYAWACLDVFIISILAAVLEISQFARFMVGDKCDQIDPIIKMFFANEPLINGHETCFDVVTTLNEGSWYLFSAAVAHTIATLLVNFFARKALDERKGKAQYQSIV
ncbi:hypothetical protein TVAG_124530 [Trichomonas vaginalis G3]|uniref:Lipid-binding serum glycoprotein N-terminal domain-containing protein n=1 Tax=Trichomonas vaginalis (strain ATCC PRA-98 / G3) TaxID=412133 RepID=A2FYN1_TRIV3|nr:hypothetical protein TVAGG3_0010700 [Trichomonas vaginalis G3]EAX89982.1 hypothetical protein TVAG_124530 [Trichomonas vaginalis G3]KAI5539122.1 hypothetical protein TVAGG3_0010700 [Trichomonas vaginalis G3]|eukprot:XP_001302912.1 hypothetical protein [Trichomonas vaginalis G3]